MSLGVQISNSNGLGSVLQDHFGQVDLVGYKFVLRCREVRLLEAMTICFGLQNISSIHILFQIFLLSMIACKLNHIYIPRTRRGSSGVGTKQKSTLIETSKPQISTIDIVIVLIIIEKMKILFEYLKACESPGKSICANEKIWVEFWKSLTFANEKSKFINPFRFFTSKGPNGPLNFILLNL
ncbi:hypothetical protein Csa_008875 [Cucumis sativus]|nr:hypothetical protein Csa_008875 [Cucumis sativus]